MRKKRGDPMQKPLQELVKYLKANILTEIPEAYVINPMFSYIAEEGRIRNGILAYREFLYQLFDSIITDADLFDKPKKIADKTTDTINLSLEYPFLRNLAMVLIHIGIHAEFSQSSDSLVLNGSQLHTALKGTRISKAIEYLQYLTNCGIYFSGIDLAGNKPNLSNAEILEVTYPDNPNMLIGLKVMAIAQLKASKCGLKLETGSYGADLDTIFLRCDYRALGGKKIQPVFMIQDVVKSFPIDMQEYLLKLHLYYMDAGCKYNTKDLCLRISFIYSHKDFGTIGSINISPVNGCVIKINAKNINDYIDMVKNFPVPLLEAVINGYSCAKTDNPDNCKQKCGGYKFSIDGKQYFKCRHLNFYIPLIDLTYSQVIEDWLDKELTYLQN